MIQSYGVPKNRRLDPPINVSAWSGLGGLGGVWHYILTSTYEPYVKREVYDVQFTEWVSRCVRSAVAMLMLPSLCGAGGGGVRRGARRAGL